MLPGILSYRSHFDERAAVSRERSRKDYRADSGTGLDTRIQAYQFRHWVARPDKGLPTVFWSLLGFVYTTLLALGLALGAAPPSVRPVLVTAYFAADLTFNCWFAAVSAETKC